MIAIKLLVLLYIHTNPDVFTLGAKTKLNTTCHTRLVDVNSITWCA